MAEARDHVWRALGIGVCWLKANGEADGSVQVLLGLLLDRVWTYLPATRGNGTHHPRNEQSEPPYDPQFYISCKFPRYFLHLGWIFSPLFRFFENHFASVDEFHATSSRAKLSDKIIVGQKRVEKGEDDLRSRSKASQSSNRSRFIHEEPTVNKRHSSSLEGRRRSRVIQTAHIPHGLTIIATCVPASREYTHEEVVADNEQADKHRDGHERG